MPYPLLLGVSTRSAHKVLYAIFVCSIFLDLITTILCFRYANGVEGNLLYQAVGFWAFPIVYLLDALILVFVKWSRKHLPYTPLILLLPTLIYARAVANNLTFLL